MLRKVVVLEGNDTDLILVFKFQLTEITKINRPGFKFERLKTPATF